jgi:hypothetical protein
LQQTSSGDNGVDNSFSFASFNYGGMFFFLSHYSCSFRFSWILDLGGGGGGEAATDGSFGSFFFGNDGSPNNTEQTSDGK